ncbi:UNVERIFIED_CONTAM: hypothetical protein ABIC26_003726 [Paenibacillus sp. PvR008]
MSFKIHSVNENAKLWTELADEMEVLENRDEMSIINAGSCCFQPWTCCIKVN